MEQENYLADWDDLYVYASKESGYLKQSDFGFMRTIVERLILERTNNSIAENFNHDDNKLSINDR